MISKINIYRIPMLILIFVIFAFADTLPSEDFIQNLWKKNSTEKMTIEGKPEKIGLMNKETAYLVPVGFYERGRNFIWHIIMVRPNINEIREINDSVQRNIIVHDINHDGISEIETISLGSGQGSTMGVRSIVQFDGWKPIILHQKEFYDNLGCCGKWGCGSCKSVDVKWSFVESNGSNLIEEIKTIKGSKITNNTNRYFFHNNALLKSKENNSHFGKYTLYFLS